MTIKIEISEREFQQYFQFFDDIKLISWCDINDGRTHQSNYGIDDIFLVTESTYIDELSEYKFDNYLLYKGD